jgi:hypothetical protein
MDREAMLNLRDQAYFKIQNDKEGLWKQWHECKTENDRELLMTWAISEIVHERGFDDGYSAGYEDGSIEFSGFFNS